MDAYVDTRYEVFKRPSNDPQKLAWQKDRAAEAKRRASILAAVLVQSNAARSFRDMETKLSEGYQLSVIHAWILKDNGIIINKSVKAPPNSGSTPWEKAELFGFKKAGSLNCIFEW